MQDQIELAGRVQPPEAKNLRTLVVEQSSTVFVTLLSILVGLVLSDLVSQARERMDLWPLDFYAMRTWAQLASNVSDAVSVWMVMAALGITRRRVPQVSDSLGTFGPPLLILCATTFVGRAEFWPWLYEAGVYLVTCVIAVTSLVHHLSGQPGGDAFRSLLRLSGPLAIIYFGAPAYLFAGLLDQLGWLPHALQLALAAGGPPASFIVVWMFFREWRDIVDASASSAA